MNEKFVIGIVLGMLGGVLVASNSKKVRQAVCDGQQQVTKKVEELSKKNKNEKSE